MTDLDLQVGRLDVENGDILVVRTRHVLTSAQAEKIHDTLERLVRRHGVRDVSVLVFDNNSDLTVERPGSGS